MRVVYKYDVAVGNQFVYMPEGGEILSAAAHEGTVLLAGGAFVVHVFEVVGP